MDHLFTTHQRTLLALLYANPRRAFYLQELGRIVGKPPGVFQKTLDRLVDDGLVISVYRAYRRFFQANTHHPLYSEVKSILAKTAGIEASLRSLVEKVTPIKLALLYGSVAKGKERNGSDVDLLIVGSPVVETRLLKELPRLEQRLQREINYKLYSEEEYRRRRYTDPFLTEVLSDRYIVLKGSTDVV